MPSYSTAEYNLIYVFSINDDRHDGLLKVGKASLRSSYSYAQLPPNCPQLQNAAHLRIRQETRTAMVDYSLEYTELAVRDILMRDGSRQTIPFDDHAVHDVLLASGYSSRRFVDSGRASEWFEVDLATVKKAITAVKEGRETIGSEPAVTFVVPERPEIHLRFEQSECVSKTIEWFNSFGNVLWDCKMRFGKTITAYELIRQKNQNGEFYKTIVITHRPAVEDGWDSDHDLIFREPNSHIFIDKTRGRIEDDEAIDAENDRRLTQVSESGKPFVYFATIQDLRGSARVKPGGFNKNNAVFDMDWDLIIIDEAHEGTKTELGDAVISALRKEKTKILSLSGTPYNLIGEFEENKYTWTYVDEQNAKAKWDEEHPDEKNPYEDLPTMNIFTFDLAEQLPDSYKFASEDAAFNFREFFRVWKGNIEDDYREIPAGKRIGDFVHEDDVFAFLSLISEDKSDSNYPFSTDEFRNMFQHTFWIVPGVKEAKALSALIQRHPRFKDDYKVINIAGEGDEEQPYDEALDLVKSAIKSYDKTITISCGKLTTGVTVREWTAVMMLTGSATTAASGYMQAIFRVQSPWTDRKTGRQKRNCYVFDFAPDRTLRVIAEVHRLSSRGEGGDEKTRRQLGEFLNFCPVIAIEGTNMRAYDVPSLMKQIKRISVENAINSGFDDDSIYKSNIIQGISDADQRILRRLANVVVPQKKGKKKTSVVINNQGLTEEERRRGAAARRKPRRELTPEEREILERLKQERQEERKLFDLLRAVSIRLPLLFYGADEDITKAIKLSDFTREVDDESWREFMPKGLGKDLFLEIVKYYDEDVITGAGQRIRRLAKAADELPPVARAKRIVEILSKFKNPDKETVLTPWRIVNLHMANTFGGYCFFDENFVSEVETPRYIDNGQPTSEVFGNNTAQILEMNSKSGLYPLYMAFSFYLLAINGDERSLSFERANETWTSTIQKHVYVLCRTKMARMITIRTLVGYTGKPVNVIYLSKLVEERMKDLGRLTRKLKNPATWGRGGEKMKFDAVVGNPPYQLEGIGQTSGKDPIYHLFIDLAKNVGLRGSLIHPGRFLFNAGKTPKEWNERITHDRTFKVVKYYPNSVDIFPTVDIKGGIAITYFDNEKDFGEIGSFCIYPELNSVIKKIQSISTSSLKEIVYPRDLYRLSDELYFEHPELAKAQAEGHKYDVGSNIAEVLPTVLTEKRPNDGETYARIYLKDRAERKLLWIKEKYLKLPDNFRNYKLFVPTISGRGSLGESFAKMYIAEPNVGSSATFISLGSFTSDYECKALIKYISTKFVRALLSSLKVTPHVTKETWANVPMQDFSEHSDIDWTKSISDIDNYLFQKYGLDSSEIEFIKNNVEEMGYLSEYQKEMRMDYSNLVSYLKQKYGPSRHNYFVDESCVEKNRLVSRMDEGLYCHHIDEDKAIMLSTPEYAQANPFDYQKADHLVYCNILEHLILHVKIVEAPRSLLTNENELPGIGGAMNFIVKQINDYYCGKPIAQEHVAKAMLLIEKDFEDYVEVLQRLWELISQSSELAALYKKDDLAKGWDNEPYPMILEALE